MTFLPIVERELRIAARLTATYRNRAILVAVVTFVAMVMLLVGTFSFSPSAVGQSMFWTLGIMALFFCLLEGVRKTADCLSEERREGTLGLLFLTDLRGYDVILGKLAATSLNSVYGLFSILPILALPMLLGGVVPGEFWRMVLALASNLFFSLAVDMWVSARSNREHRAMSGATVTMAIIVIVPLLMPRHSFLNSLSPAHAFFGASANAYLTNTTSYWRSLGYAQAMSWVMLLWASLVVPRSWRIEGIVTVPRRWWRRAQAESPIRLAYRAEARAKSLDINPAYWLATRDAGRPVMLYLIVMIIIIASAVGTCFFNGAAVSALMALFVLLNFVVKLQVAAQSCHCLAEARRNNALEMLLVTPLNIESIIQGQVLALRQIFLTPLITILSLELLGLASVSAAAWYTSGFKNSPGLDAIFGFSLAGGGVIGYLLLFVLDIFSMMWAGMWFGLSSKRESQAVTKTILFALLLPLFCSILFCYGLPFIFGIPVFWIAWGSQKVRREFRKMASQRYFANSPTANWLPGSGNQNTTFS